MMWLCHDGCLQPPALGDANDIHQYDIATATWSALQAASGFPPVARHGLGSDVAAAGEIYIFGGCCHANANDVHKFDVSTSSWSALVVANGQRPTGRYDMGFGYSDASLFVVGGYSGKLSKLFHETCVQSLLRSKSIAGLIVIILLGCRFWKYSRRCVDVRPLLWDLVSSRGERRNTSDPARATRVRDLRQLVAGFRRTRKQWFCPDLRILSACYCTRVPLFRADWVFLQALS